MSLKSAARQNYVNKSIYNSTQGSVGGVAAPVITSITVCDSSYNNLDDTALDPAGSYIKINGTGFKTGCSVYFNNQSLTATFVSSVEVRVQTPATSTGSYNLMLFNPGTGGGAIYLNLSVSNYPTFTTAAGSVGTSYEQKSFSTNIEATGDTPITYSLYSGSLPSGLTLSSNGLLSGTTPVESGSTTYTFVVDAKDAQGQDSTRTFTLTVNVDVVSWSSPSQNYVITSYEYVPITNTTLSATAASGYGVLYSANAAPAGITSNTQTGVISGTINTVGNTYTRYTATANTTGRSATRDVIFNVNQDSVTFSNPSSNNSTVTLSQGAAMSNIVLSAASAAGFGVQYSVTNLPTGVSLSGNTIYGTPTIAGSSVGTITATANTTNRASTYYINWTISIAADSYFANTTLLLSANSSIQTSSFVTDNSNNNSQLTVFGDTKVQNFNPYQLGYYSNYFDGTGDYLSFTNIAIGTGNFTYEGWIYTSDASYVYPIVVFTASGVLHTFGITNSTSSPTIRSMFAASTRPGSGNSWFTAPAISTGVWSHIAFVRSGTTISIYVNGVAQTITTTYGTNTSRSETTNLSYVGTNASNEAFLGYISNARVLNKAQYTTSFTPSTTPLTAVANTVLLTCQSNRLIDNSPNNFTITKNGDTTVSSAHPFTTPTTAAYNTQYSTYFDGTGDYLTVPDSTAFTFDSNDFTIEYWMYTSTFGSTRYIYGQSDNGASSASRNVHDTIMSDGTLNTQVYNSGTTVAIAVATLQTNTWYHVAVVRDGTTIRQYINGVQRGTGNISTNTLNDSSAVFAIGRLGAYALNSYLGNISNFRIVKGTCLYPGGTTFTPSTTPLTAVSGTSLLTCQNATLIDNSTNAFTITSNGDARPVEVSPFTMTTSNTTVTSLGSAYFDGTGDYLKLNSTLNLSTSTFTAEAWVYVTSLSSIQDIIASCANTISDNSSVDWTIRINTNGTVQFTTCSGTNNTNVISTAVILINTWNHVAVVRNGTSGTVYVNGVGVSGTISGTLNTNANLYIGIMATTNTTVGYISDVRIVKSVLYTNNFLPPQAPLTPVANTQLLTLQTNGSHNNSVFKDNSGFNNLITRAGNVTNGTFSPYGDNWSVYFNGNGDYNTYTIPAFGTNDFTIECWVYTPAMNSGNYNGIFDFSDAGYAGNLGLGIGTAASDVRLVLGGAVYDTGASTFSLNKWTHLALVRSSGTLRIYVDGVQLYSASNNTDFTRTSLNLGRWVYWTTTYQYLGYISNFRIVNGIGLYTSNFTPSTTPLTAVANTVLLTCQSNRLNDGSVTNATLTKTGAATVQKFSPFSTVTIPKYYSAYFDGTGDYLSLTGNTSVQFGSGDFTIECWLYPTSASGTFYGDRSGANFTGMVISLQSSKVTLLMSQGASWNINTYSSPTGSNVTLNTWNHVAIVRSGTTIYVFINGVQSYTAAFSGSLTQSSTVRIGAEAGDTAAYSGRISNFRMVKGTALYTSAFTPSTTPLTAISNTGLLTCQDNTFIDRSTNNFAISASGDAKPIPVSPFTPTIDTTPIDYSKSTFGGSMYFDGTGDYLTTSLPAIPGDFTFECWIYPLSNGSYPAIFSANSYTDFELQFYVTGATPAFSRASLYVGGTTIFSNTTVPVTLNAWNHLAVVRSGSAAQNVKFYVNGVYVTYGTSTGTIPATTYYIGAESVVANRYTGYISDLRMIPGAALYTGNFYPGATPLTPTTTIGTSTYSSTLLLNGTSGGIIDATRTVDFETVGDSKITTFSPYSGNNYSVLFTSGNSDSLEIANTPYLPTTTTPFTIEAWVYFNAFTSTAIASSKWAGGSIHFIMGMGNGSAQTTGSTPWFGYYNGSSWTIAVQSATSLSTGTWYHMAYVFTGSTATIYVNGTSVGSASTTWTNVVPTSTNFNIGSSWAGANFVSGYISNFRLTVGQALYTTTFTPPTSSLTTGANTKLLACQSNQFVEAKNNYSITINGVPKITTQNPFQFNSGQSYYFDGTGDYLSAAAPYPWFGTGNFTVECWINVTTVASIQIIMDARGNNVSSTPWQFYTTAAGKLAFNYGSTLTGSITLVANQWNHVAVTRSGTTLKLFVNGVADSSVSTSAALDGVGGPFYIGRTWDTSGTLYYSGYISDLRITKGYARYTTTFTPPTSPYITR